MTRRRHSTLLKTLITCLLAAVLMGGTARAWWDADWTLRKKITIDTSEKGAAITGPIGTTVILVRLHDDELQFAAAKNDGGDLRFVASDDKTLLPFHIEHYDATLAEADIWVKVPDVKPGAQITLWLYYGNDKAVPAGDPGKTYDPDTALVYHFAEHAAPAVDSTANANNAQNPGIPSDGSMIATGVRFDGKSAITVPASGSLKWADGATVTWSAWINALQADGVIFSRRDGANAFIIGVENGVPYARVTSAGDTRRTPGGAAIETRSWHHLAVVGDGSNITIYLDGAVYSTVAAAIPAMNGNLTIGGDTLAGAAGFSGAMDELEIASVARPAGFIKLAAVAQGAEGETKVIGIGQDEQQTNWMSAFNNGTMGVLVHSLTPDGWAVITILAVMMVISWSVMISKNSYLNKTTKGNNRFLKEWRHVVSDLTVLENHEDANSIKTLGGRVDDKTQRLFRHSSVYRIYHIGAEEIRHRHKETRRGPLTLSAQSIQAIRASLDAGLVRELQRLNNLMVLLTIAISGGPFLGLLGTVIGVMITFAAIAAAGDVNVNAIAPGIAAALLATVAGLAVAIPALFGYNYLTIRIKNATSDMHVFIDEFVTKMAECYSQNPNYRSPIEREYAIKEEA